MKCPKCGSKDVIRNGKNKTDKSIQRWKCKCGREFDDNTAFSANAKVLLFDIETTPMLVETWHLYPNRISIEQIMHDWNIICWRAKWLFSDEIMGACQTPHESIRRDDKRVTQKLWKLIDEADILIAHNLNKFDYKKANSRFLLHGMKPPSPCQFIDTLLAARKQFKMSSNKLDYLCKILGIGAKLNTGYQLWKDCIGGKVLKVATRHNGNKLKRIETFDAKIVSKALKEMYDYCGQDVQILEDLYLKLRPWIKSHPNMALYLENSENKCANCGSDKIEYCSKPYYTPTGIYETFRCSDCNAITRSRSSEKRQKELLRSTAR